ncbi:pyrroline-5-carboxylate reductase [Kordiimonas sediminis]|uniref:Pyrroline-5-carboxylate reductase n=1 Tax=Kordiimonas sediminis TaxID=1735581 RepID=A0A919AJ51_9PROT|nr:pyrroline-5-carboxylate reductase [Kordiimonas sediminis]GHF11056.1 pyrroline-5-carboxylate reductase [Kordiimonas sediminis]
MDILMVGCGRMGGAMLERWTTQKNAIFTVVDPAATDLPGGVRGLKQAASLGSDTFDMIIIAVKPQMIEDVMPAYDGRLRDGGCMVSIAAGYSLDSLTKAVGDVPIIRVMPNLPALIGKGATGLYASEHCSDTHKDAVSDLMAHIGLSVWVPSEDHLDRLTAVSGSGPGYVFQFIESFTEGAKALGFSDTDAQTLVLQTVLGAAEMAASTRRPASDLRDSVTSKGGTTQAGLDQLRTEQALDKLMQQTTQAAYERAVELR